MTPQTASTKPGATDAIPARHTIRIVIEDGKIRYLGAKGQDVTELKVRRGDTIVWQSDHGNYAVLFKSKTPFSNVGFHGHRGMPSRKAKVIGVNDHYFYAVTVVHPETGQPLVDDPVIIVNDGD
jgi:hypothetical protein